MSIAPVLPSLTRISTLDTEPYEVRKLDRSHWATGDYVVLDVLAGGGGEAKIELPNGRQSDVFAGYQVVGALGHRFATLELVGSWEAVEADLSIQLLTAGGLAGRVTSRSAFVADPIEAVYVGHAMRGDGKVTMRGSVAPPPKAELTAPVVLIVGTSMSAGKTTSARLVVRQLRQMGKRVVGAKLTGAGRYRDVLAMKDAGAQEVLDFVDVGLPSSVVPPEEFRVVAGELLARIAALQPDVVVIEAGASPLEPYNGGVAVELLDDIVRMTILAASDPYAVLGIVQAFKRQPDLVTGPTANTDAGVQLVERLTGVPALDVRASGAGETMRALLESRFGKGV